MRFSGVGAIGFVVDGCLLWILVSNGIDAYFCTRLLLSGRGVDNLVVESHLDISVG
ncbi:MAG TPA: hypothetical protein VMX97_01590 [Hyphomicrobiaceae bacterium]|nr:hypothetical protein [Hyphomicrobiaceae bacterium]